MSHHHSDPEPVNQLPSVATPEKTIHPFLEEPDVTYLSLIRPLLSQKGQKLLGFFIDFSNQSPGNDQLDLSAMLKGLSTRFKNSSSLNDLLPTLLNMAANSEGKGKLSPALLTTMMSLLNTKKED